MSSVLHIHKSHVTSQEVFNLGASTILIAEEKTEASVAQGARPKPGSQ